MNQNLKIRRLWAALALFAAPTTHAQVMASPGLDTLHGFRLGISCERQEPAYQQMRQQGFDVPAVRYACFRHPGAFQTDYLLKDADGKQELVELFYRPDSTLWRARVTITWAGAPYVGPTPEQVEKSLVRRFGAPFTRGSDGARGPSEEGLVLTWGRVKQPDNPAVQALASMTRSFADLEGVVTQALLRWEPSTRHQSLVVETTSPEGLNAAARAQQAESVERARAQADRDANVLGSL